MLRGNLLVTSLLVVLSLTADAGAFQPQQPPGVDQQGDPLPVGAVARLGTVRWLHDGIVTFAAFLPDGKTVVSSASDNTIRF
jgi:WD40 repeat protein